MRLTVVKKRDAIAKACVNGLSVVTIEGAISLTVTVTPGCTDNRQY